VGRRHPAVVRHGRLTGLLALELGDTMPVHEPAIIADYIASWPPESIGLEAGPLWNQVLAATGDPVAAHFAANQCFLITSRVAILRCR
jgi:hypothetical protein